MADPLEIYVLGKTVKLLQPEKGFRTSMDSVMVAAACPARAGERILDMGCGVGAVAFCLLRRVPGVVVTGVDTSSDCLALAARNARINGADTAASFIRCDIRQFSVTDPAQRFDHAVCNPPFLEAGTHTRSPDAGRAAALGHDEEGMGLAAWIDAGFHNLRSGGSLTLIHRADALDRVIQALGRRFGAVEIIPLWPRAGEAAKRVVVRAVKDRKSPAVLHAGLVLHEAGGGQSAAAEAVLRDGAALFPAVKG